MGFIVRNLSKSRHHKPPGHYVKLNDDAVEYTINKLTITNSGNVVLHIQDPINFDTKLITICNIEDIVNNIPGGATYINY